MTVKNGSEVRVEKLIHRPARDVFQAVAEGRLFNNCGATMRHVSIDFRVGGEFRLGFHGAEEAQVRGKFTEIIPDQRIRFTWGDEGSDPGFPRSEVLIELFADGPWTRVVLEHTGLPTAEQAEDHDEGWTSGLDDLALELAEGRIRLVRVYPVNRRALYEACAAISKGFGKIKDAVPDRKITPFEGVTLLFDDEEDGQSSLELLHASLPPESIRSRREGWEHFLAALQGLVHSRGIHHEVGIRASQEDVYQALTERERLAGWWTSDTRGDGSKVGGVLEFWFGDFCQKLEVTELEPGKLVRWKASREETMDEWAGTEITFSLSADEGQCLVRLVHSGWRDENGMLPHCSTKWAVFMVSLKEYLEKGRGHPAPEDIEINHY